MTTLAEKELLSEKDFKNVLENKILVLLAHGKWKASIDMGMKVLTHKNGDILQLFIQQHSMEVLAGGHVVNMTSSSLVEKALDLYATTLAQQELEEQERLQKVVLATVEKLTEGLAI